MLQPTVKYSGVHVHKNALKAGIALFPGEGGLSYPRHYVARPVIPEGGYPGGVDELGNPLDAEDYRNWLASLPTVMALNPCLTHFIRIGPDTTLAQLESEIQGVFTPDVLATVDALLATRGEGERADMSRLRRLMNAPERLGSGLVLPGGSDRQLIVAEADSKFKGLAGELDGGGRLMEIDPGTIDVGPGAIDRSTALANTYTIIDEANPANASGSLDTVEIWVVSDSTGVKVGTFYGSGTSRTSRDYETIGSVTAGSKQTFSGLDIDVETNDLIGVKIAGGSPGQMERGSEGSPVGILFLEGDFFDGSPHTYNEFPSTAISLYGTGAESATPKTSSDAGSGAEASDLTASGEVVTGDSGTGAETNPARDLTAAETGQASEAAAALVALATGDSGCGADYSGLPKAVTGADIGWGLDRILLRIEMAGGGVDMSLPGRRGRTSIPNKEASG